MTTHSDASRRTFSTPLVLAAAAIVAVGFLLMFGTASLDVAKVAVPHQLVLKTAQLGFVAPAAQAAPIASTAAYLPAQIVVQGLAVEPHPSQF
jgi:uncharacterized membrane protein YjjP (DUF1212 family)